MNRDEAIEHLRMREQKLDKTNVNHYPKWTTPDYVALKIVLSGLLGTMPRDKEGVGA